MTRDKKTSRRRALALTIAAGLAGAGCLCTVLAESAGAATPADGRARPAVGQIVAMPAAEPSAPPTTATPGPAPNLGAPPSGPTQRAQPSQPSQPSQPAQLSSNQLPAPTVEKWVPVDTPTTKTITGHDIGENECAKVTGADMWTQQAFSGGDGQNVAIQDTFVFAGAGAAQSAYQNVVAGMGACQQTTRALQAQNKVPLDATVTETASRPGAAAWERSWTGVMGMSAAGPQTNHLYVAMSGTRLIVLQFTEFPGQAAPYRTAADPAALTTLTDELAQ